MLLACIVCVATCGDSTTELEGEACEVGQEWGPGESCVVSGGYRFEVQDAEFACFSKIQTDVIESDCSNREIESGGFSAGRVGDTVDWRINSVP